VACRYTKSGIPGTLAWAAGEVDGSSVFSSSFFDFEKKTIENNPLRESGLDRIVTRHLVQTSASIVCSKTS
jgi:hypothetical protein